MLPTVEHALHQAGILPGAAPLIVGFSGGPDSLALLHCLASLGCTPIAAHFDHQLRPSSAAEAHYAAGLAAALAVPFVQSAGDVPAYAAQQRLSLEEAARQLRYTFLFAQAQAHHAAAVLTAHHADDQVETVLMHFLRGAGLAGLRGMLPASLPNPWSDHIPLLRPLLAVSRTQIDAYCQAHKLQPQFDPSNHDLAFFRNRLRHDLLPQLETYSPQLRAHLLQLADTAAADLAALEHTLDSAWSGLLVGSGAGYLLLDPDAFRRLPLSLQRLALRRALALVLPGLRNLDFPAVERARTFALAPVTHTQVDLLEGVRLAWESGLLCFFTASAGLPAAYPQLPDLSLYPLPVPGRLDLAAGWTLTAVQASDPAQAFASALTNSDPYQAWLSLDGHSLPLQVRPRRPGDRFAPLGLAGHTQRLTDLFTNLKVPPRLRVRYPLVCAGETILWLPGLRLSHFARLDPTSRQIVHLSLRSN